jgi:hypothetical protein
METDREAWIDGENLRFSLAQDSVVMYSGLKPVLCNVYLGAIL